MGKSPTKWKYKHNNNDTCQPIQMVSFKLLLLLYFIIVNCFWHQFENRDLVSGDLSFNVAALLIIRKVISIDFFRQVFRFFLLFVFNFYAFCMHLIFNAMIHYITVSHFYRDIETNNRTIWKWAKLYTLRSFTIYLYMCAYWYYILIINLDRVRRADRKWANETNIVDIEAKLYTIH